MANIKIGASLYSFTNEQRDLGWSTEDCIREIKNLGLDGFEIVGSQTFSNYPWPSDQQIDEVRNLAEKYGLEISSYSAQADRGKYSMKQDLSEDDMFTYALNDLKVAYKLGAKAQRQQCQVYPEVMRRLAPWAEAYGIRVGVEMHTPMTPRETGCAAFNKVFDEVNSPFIGWTPDFGMFDTKAPQLNSQLKVGKSLMRRMYPSRVNVPAEVCDFYEENLDRFTPEEMKEAISRFDLTERQFEDVCVMFKGMDVAGDTRDTIWEDFENIIIPHAVYFHGKFNEIGKDGDDVSIHTSRILEIIGRSNYDGFISIEYEGHDRFPDVPIIPILRDHIEFYHKVLHIS